MPEAAHDLLTTLRAARLQIGVDGPYLTAGPRERITPVIREAIQANRDALLGLVLGELRDDVLERAAILEFDGGYTRAEADRLALTEFGFVSWDQFTLPPDERAAA
jgi:hypothetical protein